MEKWLQENLSGLLDFPVPTDLTSYILQMQNARDLDEYLKTLLDYDNPKHRQFVSELKKRQAGNNDLMGYKKSSISETSINPKQNDKKKGKSKGANQQTQMQENIKPERVEKKKTKFVNLYSPEGRDRETIMLKGRHKCNCEAKKHSLINNCISCGRIVCSQEGAGPCFCCGDLVCSPEQQALLSSNSRQADNLYNKLMDQKPPKDVEESLKHRNKLLEYDRNSARRTEVIDDECDYYQTNSVWLSNSEREKLEKYENDVRAKKYGSRLNRKVTLDFAGREVIDDAAFTDEANDQVLRSITEFKSSSTTMSSNACPTIEFNQPSYVDVGMLDSKRSKNLNTTSFGCSRIQDKEFLEMVDEGLCLSMHQPYASLLTSGIKTHEGRTWYSAHRGRLWIAAASKVPSTEEITALENRYRVLKNESIKFPKSYPTGCLLGCVTVVDVLSEEDYRKKYPDGDSESPYVFICEDCHELPVRFPMQGKHKIYKLDSKIHRAAVNSLQRKMKLQAGT
ncbi:activating signal cointegrator 1 [Diprion similis]|uniref:activating signal cointegrator 1 n=1 Tax=Diprion similis TaxID=362088 RepID=UPI001EF8D8FE|nr:activating signal cointegrator 1 [Diprion similis]